MFVVTVASLLVKQVRVQGVREKRIARRAVGVGRSCRRYCREVVDVELGHEIVKVGEL
jgi:hypothetical protein